MKKFLLFLLSLLFIKNVNAEVFTNLNYMDWELQNQNSQRLNSGTTPFLTSYLGRDYPNARLIFDYTNYDFYPGYYYDVTLNYHFDNKNDIGTQNFSEGVTVCEIYPWQSANSYTSDDCEIVQKTATNLKVRVSNLRTNNISKIAIRLINTFNFSSLPNEVVYVQLNSYELNIVRKDNTGVSGDEFNSGVNNIINNQNNNSQNEIDNANQNKQDIIDNQNANTDKEIESQKVCSNKTINSSDFKNFGILNLNGSITAYNQAKYTDFIELEKLRILESQTSSVIHTCFYDHNKQLLHCIPLSNFSIGQYSLPSGTKYIRASIYLPTGYPIYQIETCINGNQAITDKIDDSSVDSPSGVFDELNNKLATNNVISSLITLPITFYTNVLNGLNGTCSSFNLGNLLGTDIILPCINISTYIGNTLWNIIDILFSGFFILHMSKKFIAVFDNMSSLKDGDVIDD